MPDKLTDSEIVKALEDTLHRIKGAEHLIAPKEGVKNLCNGLQNALDLINRQKAENKSQSIMIKMLKGSIEDYKNSYINQKAEIERLKIENAKLRGYKTNDWLIRGISPEQLEQEKIQVWKAEAYKEFAEKMEERIAVKLLRNKSNEYVEGFVDALDGVNGEIDNLLKELVGGGGCDTCKSLTCDGCELYEELVGEDNAEEKE